MKKKYKNKIGKLTFFLIILILAATVSYFLDFKDMKLVSTDSLINDNSNDYLAETVEPLLEVHYIDVGQADAILIKQGEHSMLIDAGKNTTKDYLNNYIIDKNITKFEYVVGTHVHEDHIGGMDMIVKNFDIDNIFFPKSTSNTKTFENFISAVKLKNKKIYSPKSGEKFKFGDAELEIIAPNSSKYDDLNNYSICIKLTYKKIKFLFMGDAEELSEREILDNNLDIDCNVLKLGHHGSKTSTSSQFLEKVSPQYAVLSCGKNNDYSHPAKTTMLKLKANDIKVFRTDESGTIVLSTDGENISSNVKEGTYNYGK